MDSRSRPPPSESPTVPTGCCLQNVLALSQGPDGGVGLRLQPVRSLHASGGRSVISYQLGGDRKASRRSRLLELP